MADSGNLYQFIEPAANTRPENGSPEEVKSEMVMASYFAKINAIFLIKRLAEVNAYLFTTVLSRPQGCAQMFAFNHRSWRAC